MAEQQDPWTLHPILEPSDVPNPNVWYVQIEPKKQQQQQQQQKKVQNSFGFHKRLSRAGRVFRSCTDACSTCAPRGPAAYPAARPVLTGVISSCSAIPPFGLFFSPSFCIHTLAASRTWPGMPLPRRVDQGPGLATPARRSGALPTCLAAPPRTVH